MAPVSFALGLAGLGLALAARPSAHVRAMRAAPPGAGPGGAGVVVDTALGAELRSVVAFDADASDGSRAFTFVPRASTSGALDAPDLLLYGAPSDWSPGSFPRATRFIGPASTSEPTTIELDRSVAALVLYSLGHGRVVGVLEVPRAMEER